ERFKDALAKQGGVVAKNFQSNVVIYEKSEESIPGAEPKLEKKLEDKIWMNNPLKFDGYTLYQAGYQLDECTNMTFKIHETNDPEKKALGESKPDLASPESEYESENGFRIV